MKVYCATKNLKNPTGPTIHFDEVAAVKAGTGVLVEAEEGTYDFTVESNDADYESDLVGSVATKARTSINATVYTLQNGPAFKPYTGENVTGFRSHIETPASAGIKAFDIILGDDETAIKSFEANEAYEAYDLQGRKLGNMPSKAGIYIINGKKILR